MTERKSKSRKVVRDGLKQTSRILLDLAEGLLKTPVHGWRGPLRKPSDYDAYNEYWEEHRRVKMLEKKRLIKLRKVGDRIEYKLTNDGWHETLKLRIMSSEAKLPEGELCIVTFDIPEDIRNVRDTFRYVLKKAKFKQSQRSVWTSNRDVARELAELAKALRAQKYIHIYSGSKIEL